MPATLLEPVLSPVLLVRVSSTFKVNAKTNKIVILVLCLLSEV